MANQHASRSVGGLLREWRQRQRLSQLELASTAGVSSRHLSFVETGRARPSREMILHLAEHLEVPLRQRNALLLAAGFAPSYHETDLAAPEMGAVREALDRVLAGHEPYPAVVVDRQWNITRANDACGLLLERVAPELLVPPVNALRVSLHPEGMAPHIVNLAEWSEHLLGRLRRQVLLSGDEKLKELEDELRQYPGLPGAAAARHGSVEGPSELAVTLRIDTDLGELTFLSTIATFGTAIDITLAELSIEAFLPADGTTAAALHLRTARK